jgi:hypothetical protein
MAGASEILEGAAPGMAVDTSRVKVRQQVFESDKEQTA